MIINSVKLLKKSYIGALINLYYNICWDYKWDIRKERQGNTLNYDIYDFNFIILLLTNSF